LQQSPRSSRAQTTPTTKIKWLTVVGPDSDRNHSDVFSADQIHLRVWDQTGDVERAGYDNGLGAGEADCTAATSIVGTNHSGLEYRRHDLNARRNVLNLSDLVLQKPGKRARSERRFTAKLDRCKQRTHRVALPFCHIQLTARKPLPPAYPRELRTLGDHLRKRRLDLGLLQRDVAEQLHVHQMTITNWETGRTSPQLRFVPRILSFLGYNPNLS